MFNDESNDQQVEILAEEGNLDLNIKANKYYLKPFDQVFIRELPNYQVQEKVSVQGEVNYPGEYAIKSRVERISDVLERAGGQRTDAYLKGAKFFRNEKQVSVDFENLLKNQTSAINLFLENGDKIIIPKEAQVVYIGGQVLNPATVAFQPNFSFKEYIIQAGGFSDSAYVKKTYVKYANGLTDHTRSFMGIKTYPRVERGMQIVVPVKRRERLSKAEILSLSTAFVSLSAVLLTLVRLL